MREGWSAADKPWEGAAWQALHGDGGVQVAAVGSAHGQGAFQGQPLGQGHLLQPS